ncbi:MAG: hypothetical protein K6B14_08795 [Lachnospiraceae bacterium]|nr:hypothetical protein [Lachnospiraceae bacterium]
MKKKLCVFLSICAAVSLLICGCSIGDTGIRFGSGPGVFNVFSIGNMSCPKSEVLVYLGNAKNLYGIVGDVSLWSEDYPTASLQDGVKNNVLGHLTRVYTLDIYAQENEIELADIELSRVSDAADEYFESLSETEKEYFGVTRDDINDMYIRYATAMKVYADLMNQVDEEVSEDEARIMDAYVLFTTNESDAKKVRKGLKDGKDFLSLLSTYGEGDTGLLSFGRGTYDESVEEKMFSLDDEEVSDQITGPDGFYFVMCMDKYDDELSEANKASIVTRRKEEVIEKIIKTQYDEYDSQFDKEFWDQLEIQDEGIETDSFFSVLESHLKF